MTAPTDQFIEIAKRNQEALVTATRSWIDIMQSIAGAASSNGTPVVPGVAGLPGVLPYVDGLFDVAEKLLVNQREIAQQWVGAAVRTTEVVTDQAVRATKSVSQHTVNGIEAAVDNGTEAARATGERAVSSVRAAQPSKR
jgi:hypothetical protein